jgi:glycosyltransferase involved in cell wall biosynthesis
LWRNAYATLEKSGVRGELSGLAFALAVSDPACRLRTTAREFSKTADFVVHEFPFSEPIFSDGCTCPEIYNSHNFETSLLSAVAHGEGLEAAQLKLMRLEGNLVARAHRVFSTSESDSEKFRLFFGADPKKLAVCPNGMDHYDLQEIAQARVSRDEQRVGRPKLLFTGSAHNPNVEAGSFLLELANQLPECDIVLAGGLCAALPAEGPPSNIELFGPFDEAEKVRLLTEADLYLNPVTVGSGTSLKALEALGAAIPMVSTSEGVRGLGLTAGLHCEILPREEFARVIRELLRDRGRAMRLATEGSFFLDADSIGVFTSLGITYSARS